MSAVKGGLCGADKGGSSDATSALLGENNLGVFKIYGVLPHGQGERE